MPKLRPAESPDVLLPALDRLPAHDRAIVVRWLASVALGRILADGQRPARRQGPEAPAAPLARPRRPKTKAERSQISARMKAYWQRRREQSQKRKKGAVK